MRCNDSGANVVSGPRWLLFVVILATAMTGCGGDTGPQKFTVTGEVRLDDIPVPAGYVTFTPVDGKGPPAAGRIVDGKYELETTPGKKSVQLAGSIPHPTETQRGIDGGQVPRLVEFMPKEYGSDSKLTVEVTEDMVYDLVDLKGAREPFVFE